MTAVNFWVKPDGVHCYSDGLAYTPDGTIVTIAPKAFTLAALPAVIAFAGSVAMAQVVRTIAENDYRSFDALAVALPDIMARVKEEMPHEAGRVYLGGWSDKGQRFVVVQADSDNIAGRAGELVETHPGEDSLMPFDQVLAERVKAAGVDLYADDVDPLTAGPVLVRAQRESPFEWPVSPGKRFRAVGGFTQHTFVTRDSVTSRIVERFPDHIGRKVGEPAMAALAA